MRRDPQTRKETINFNIEQYHNAANWRKQALKFWDWYRLIHAVKYFTLVFMNGTTLAVLLAQVSLYTKRERLLMWCLAIPLVVLGVASWYFILRTLLAGLQGSH